jgi:dTDP-4-dehydrorhamnose reductase
MKILITGSNGMLGKQLIQLCRNNYSNVKGLDLSHADFEVDLINDQEIELVFKSFNPDIVINCAAIVNISHCDSNPLDAWNVNARAVAILAEKCKKSKAKLVQISTDHYFTGNHSTQHNEQAEVTLLNEYARTKYAGEAFAMTGDNNLVVRTNIIGFRGHGKPTFAEWALEVAESNKSVTLFDDAFVSSIDTYSFGKVLLDLIDKDSSGLYNLANREVFSKKALIEKIAEYAGYKLTNVKTGSVKELSIARPNSCGLDVRKAEQMLGYQLPTLNETIATLLNSRSTNNIK